MRWLIALLLIALAIRYFLPEPEARPRPVSAGRRRNNSWPAGR